MILIFYWKTILSGFNIINYVRFLLKKTTDKYLSKKDKFLVDTSKITVLEHYISSVVSK